MSNHACSRPTFLLRLGIFVVVILGCVSVVDAREFLLARCQMVKGDHCTLHLTPTRFWKGREVEVRLLDANRRPVAGGSVLLKPITSMGKPVVGCTLDDLLTRQDVVWGATRTQKTSMSGAARFPAVADGDYSIQVDWGTLETAASSAIVELRFETADRAASFFPVSFP